MKKIIFISLLSFFFSFLSPDKTLAQGKTWCAWDSNAGVCVSRNDCEPGYDPHPRNCESLNELTCGGILDCVLAEEPEELTTPNQTQNGNGETGGDTIETALGPINVKSPEDFVESILTLAIGIGGGIAMLLIIFGGFQVLTSSGNPEQVKAGKEMITSAIAGLMLIIFAVFILRIIGVEILNIFE